jgi:very-short-patch-repair endonuclease
VKPDRYSELRRVARRRSQRGCFTSAQARAVGVSARTLSRLVAKGIVVREAPRVYRFGVTSASSWKDPLAVELLRTGGIASGLSAAALYGLVEPPPAPCVLVPRGSRSAVPGRHTSRELARTDTAVVDGLRALSPMRAVLDSVQRLPRHSAISLIETAIVKGLVKPVALRRRATELSNAKRPGCAVTLQILAELHPELARSRNEWEALVARRAQQLDLPSPELEFELFIDGHRYLADAAWPAHKVALEFDGRDPHMRRSVHDYDTTRRNDFTSAGWLRFGITASALRSRDDRTFAQVARAIEHPAADGGTASSTV